MYRVYPVPGGHQIFWCPSWPRTDADKLPHSAKIYPFPQGAHRRAKQLNDAIREIDAMIQRDGAIIL